MLKVNLIKTKKLEGYIYTLKDETKFVSCINPRDISDSKILANIKEVTKIYV